MTKNIQFYTMFYVDFRHQSLSGNMQGTFHEQMETFIGCCETLHRSLKYHTGHSLTILTNSREYIGGINPSLNCKEIDFILEIPEGIGFFAAHYKLDVCRYLAGLQDDGYYFLIDSDVVCLNSMPDNMINCIQLDFPMYFDITKQYYPAYGRDVMVAAKQLLAPDSLSTGFWIGGEFLAGNATFFDELLRESEKILPAYLQHYRTLFHQSDETLFSVVLEKMMMTRRIVNIGDFGGIGKFWSCSTKHIQCPIEAYADHFLLHLPADKNYLGSLKSDIGQFFNRYRNRLRRRRLFPVHLIRSVIGRMYHQITGRIH